MGKVRGQGFIWNWIWLFRFRKKKNHQAAQRWRSWGFKLLPAAQTGLKAFSVSEYLRPFTWPIATSTAGSVGDESTLIQ